MTVRVDPFPAEGLDSVEESRIRLAAGTDARTMILAAAHHARQWSTRGREHYALWVAEGLMLYAMGLQAKAGGIPLVEAQLSRWIEHLLSHHSNLTGRKITWGVRFQPPEKGEKDDAEEEG